MYKKFQDASLQRVEQQSWKIRANELFAIAGLENASQKPIKLFGREP